MMLLTKANITKLRKNDEARCDLCEDHDPKPVVKLFLPGSACTWLLTELDQDGCAFGLCDLGHGYPELGRVDINELTTLRHPRFGIPVERDRYFTATKPISAYAEEARNKGRIEA